MGVHNYLWANYNTEILKRGEREWHTKSPTGSLIKIVNFITDVTDSNFYVWKKSMLYAELVTTQSCGKKNAVTSIIDPGGFGHFLSSTVVGRLLARSRRWDFLTYATN